VNTKSPPPTAEEIGALLSRNTPTTSQEQIDLGTQLVSHLAELPLECRQILALHHFEAMPFPDVAAALSISESRVRETHAQALSELSRRVAQRMPIHRDT